MSCDHAELDWCFTISMEGDLVVKKQDRTKDSAGNVGDWYRATLERKIYYAAITQQKRPGTKERKKNEAKENNSYTN